MNSISELIINKRKEHGITQKQLAEMLHLTPSAISKWETKVAVPHISQFPQIAEALQIPVSDLYVLTIDNSNQPLDESYITTVIEENLEDTPTDILPERHTLEKTISKKRLLFYLFCTTAMILLILGTTLYISKSCNRQPVLQIVDEYYSEKQEVYGYSDIYYVVIEYNRDLSEDFLQSYEKELRNAYLDKFEQASIIIVQFYKEYSDFKSNYTPDMKLVLLPPRKE